jgi:hypothetical protein
MRTRADVLALAALAAVFAVGWALVAPWSDVPVVDDYAYAWSVEHLLKTGRIAINDRSSIYPIVQMLWGALFARLFGFSFGALRLSTVVASIAGCWAIYLTLRELAFDATVSLLGALTVAWYPTWFVLSFTFMTDIPFVSLSAIALYFYVSGLRRDRPSRMWLGTLFAVLAFLVRQVGAVLPLAAFAAIDRRTLSWSAARRLWLPVVAGVAAVVALWFALPAVFGPLPVIERRSAGLTGLADFPLREYAGSNVGLLWIVAFPLAPLLVYQFTRSRRTVMLAGGAVVLVGVAFLITREIPSPLPNGETWSLQDLALRTNLFDGEVPSTAAATRLGIVLGAIGSALVAALLAGLPSVLPAVLPAVARSAKAGARSAKAGRILLAAGLLHLGLINVLWVYYDRYYLIMLPALVYVAAAPLRDRRLRVWPAAIVLAAWAVISVTGTRDVLTTNAIAARFVRDLEAQGVRPIDVDAGYTLNGWRLYVHPENLPPGADPHTDVPFVSTDEPSPYRIVTIPVPGHDVVRSEKLPAAWWQVTDHIYVVRERER